PPLIRKIEQHSVQWREQIVRRLQDRRCDLPDQSEGHDVADNPQRGAYRHQPPAPTTSTRVLPTAHRTLSPVGDMAERLLRPCSTVPADAFRLHVRNNGLSIRLADGKSLP